MDERFINVVFSGPPGPGDECVFVEVEGPNGNSVNAGEWTQREDGLWQLRITEASVRNNGIRV